MIPATAVLLFALSTAPSLDLRVTVEPVVAKPHQAVAAEPTYGHREGLFMALGQMADAATTCAVFAGGGGEGNPYMAALFGNPPKCHRVFMVKSALVSLVWFSARSASKHPEKAQEAKWISRAVGIIGYAAAGWNLYQLQRVK